MMAAYRLRGLGWFTSCAAIVLGFYLVSLQVAGERNKLEALNARIRTAQRDIRALETEFDTRANLQQLEKWNGDILALSAPVAGQFVADERRLASVRFDVPPTPAGEGATRTAALVVPALSEMRPAVQVAATPAKAAPAVASASVRSNAAVRTAAPAARPASTRAQRVAMLEGDLLADLGVRARAEASR